MSQNGPSFTKATYDKKRQRKQPPSPARVEVEEKEIARSAADTKLMATNPRAWVEKHKDTLAKVAKARLTKAK